MQDEKFAELRRRFPWMRLDCGSALTVIVLGRRGYGIEWFAKRRRAVDMAGAGIGYVLEANCESGGDGNLEKPIAMAFPAIDSQVCGR